MFADTFRSRFVSRRLLVLNLMLLGLACGPLALRGATAPVTATPRDEAVSPQGLRELIEKDFIRQVEALNTPKVSSKNLFYLTPQDDAAGGCDGFKTGKFGFHTKLEPNPWWQVDLGKSVSLGRVVIYNRMDYPFGLHIADSLQILTSEDGKQWTLRHDNKKQGKHFGGIKGAPPLTVKFQPDEVRARFVRVMIPNAKPIFLHLDEVEVYGAEQPERNLALGCPANQSSFEHKFYMEKFKGPKNPMAWPVGEFLERGRRLARELTRHGVDVKPAQQDLERIAGQWQALDNSTTASQARDLYLQTRWTIRRLALANPLLDFNKMLFVKRNTQEAYPDVCLNHMPWVSAPGGDLCVLSAPSSGSLFPALADPKTSLTLRNLLAGALGPGHVHGMDLWWDASRIVFGYAKTKTNQPPKGWLSRPDSYRLRRTEEPIHIFEADLKTGAVRQLTDGEWSDLDPTYAPNGDIVFVSERCGTSLQCNEFDKDETSCNLYVMKPDGSAIRRMSVSKDGDYLPHTLDDGTIAYTRWEYHERGFAYIQSIWTVRPDGTGADAIFKQHFAFPWALEDTRSIPGSRKLVSIAAGHHTLAMGPLVVIDTAQGLNNPKGISILTPGVNPPEGDMDGVPIAGGGVLDNGGFYSTPWALSENFFLVSYGYGKETDRAGYGLYLVDAFGNRDLIYRDPAISCFMAMPLRPRPVPRILPELVDVELPFATCAVTDASFGMEGIDPKQVKYLRISEPVGWPYDNKHGGHRYGEHHRYWKDKDAWRKNLLSWTPIRVLGDVPVDPDGSVYFRVPADVAVYFQLLDENRMELRRMRSFISFQPGESRACAGCHESRAGAPVFSPSGSAMKRPAAIPEPPPWGDRAINFLRDVQPVLDRHCVKCHSGLKPMGGLDFSGGLTTHDHEVAGYGYNRAYETILVNKLVNMSAVGEQDATITPPMAYGSHKSKLIATLSKLPHTKRVKLSDEDRRRLVTWIDANAPYHDLFVVKRMPVPEYDLAQDKDLAATITAVHQRRCVDCHNPAEISRLDWIDLHQPRASLFLAAPLAKAAGGTGKCGDAGYKDASDPDYKALAERVEQAVRLTWERPRRDLKAFKSDSETNRAAEAAAWRTTPAKVGIMNPRVH